MRDDRARLRDISLAIDRIQKETAAGRVEFRRDPKLQVWVLYHLQIIGEACRSLLEEGVLGRCRGGIRVATPAEGDGAGSSVFEYRAECSECFAKKTVRSTQIGKRSPTDRGGRVVAQTVL